MSDILLVTEKEFRKGEAVFRATVGASAIAGIVLTVAALVCLVSGSTPLLAVGMIAFMTGLVLVAPALVRPLSAVFGALLALLFARQGTGTIASNNLSRQSSRSAVTASTTMIALALVVALAGMTVSISSGFLGILKTSLGSDYIFVPPAVAVWDSNIGAGSDLAGEIRKIEGVEAVSTLRYARAVLRSGAEGSTVSVLGVDPVAFPRVSALSFTSGSASTAFRELGEGRTAIVNPILAASNRLAVGSTLSFVTAEGSAEYRVVAVATDFLDAKIATVFLSQANLAHDFHKTEDVFIQVNLERGADAKAADGAIRRAGEAYPQFSIVLGREYYNQMSTLFTAVFSALYIMLAFLSIPSLLTTLNTLAIGVIERTREIGMLRAVGTTTRQVGRIVLAEALLLAALGTVFGLAAGLYLGYLLVRAIGSVGFPAPYVFPWGGVVAAVVIGLGFGALASIIPARKAAGLQIVEALRYE